MKPEDIKEGHWYLMQNDFDEVPGEHPVFVRQIYGKETNKYVAYFHLPGIYARQKHYRLRNFAHFSKHEVVPEWKKPE